MGRLGTLDGLRPLLILWICSFHWAATGVVKEGGEVWPSWFGVVAWSLDKLQRRAWLACDCFFVLAGFVGALGASDMLTGPSAGRARRGVVYVYRGFARVAPAYYCSLALWVAVLFLHDAQAGVLFGASPEKVYTQREVKTLSSFSFPLTLAMAQSWYPTYARDLSWSQKATLIQIPAHFRDQEGHMHSRDQEGYRAPHDAVFVPYAVDYALWFVSALVGCRVLFAVLGPRVAPESPAGLGVGICVCCALRLVPALVAHLGAACEPPRKGAWEDNPETYRAGEGLFWLDTDPKTGEWACLGKWVEASGYVFPPFNFCSFFAGALSARLALALERDGFLRVVADHARGLSCGLALAFPLVFRALPDDSALVRTRTTPLTAAFCAFCVVAKADGGEGRGPVLGALAHPFLAAAAPAAFAVFAFQPPFIKFALLAGFDVSGGQSGAASFTLVLVGLWAFAFFFSARIEPKLAEALLALGPQADEAPRPKYGTFKDDVETATKEEPFLARFVGSDDPHKKRPSPPPALTAMDHLLAAGAGRPSPDDDGSGAP